jgi:hypothetical protein
MTTQEEWRRYWAAVDAYFAGRPININALGGFDRHSVCDPLDRDIEDAKRDGEHYESKGVE